MISSAAIQKLERYGQLGLKRKTVSDFVQSSLKDSKRSNIYALTHQATWEECCSALYGFQHTQRLAKIEEHSELHEEERELKEEQTKAHKREINALSVEESMSVVNVSDSLVYSVSFTIALLTHHIRTIQGKSCKLVHKGEIIINKKSNSVSIFDDDLHSATALLSLLKHVMLACASHVEVKTNYLNNNNNNESATCRIHYSSAMTEAVAHLMSSSVDLTLFTLSLLVTTSNNDDNNKYKCVNNELSEFCQHLTVLLGATAKLLRRAMAEHCVPSVLRIRTCPSLLKSQLAKISSLQQQQQQQKEGVSENNKKSKKGIKEEREKGSVDVTSKWTLNDPLVYMICRIVWNDVSDINKDSFNSSTSKLFEQLSLFHKLSLLHALTKCTIAPELFVKHHIALRQLLIPVYTNAVCSRATRYVIYYRGDDLKLLHSNIRQASEYALHTSIVTAPTEPSLIEQIILHHHSQSSSSSSSSSSMVHVERDKWEAESAFLLHVWMASSEYFFESFCLHDSWTAFAEEQRRMALLRHSLQRREMNENKQRNTNKKTRNEINSNYNNVLTAEQLAKMSSTTPDTQEDVNSNVNSDVDDDDDDDRDDNASLISHDTMHSMLSLESRGSLLSTLSRHSAESYLSFLSVLKPERSSFASSTSAVAPGTSMELEPTLKLHESEDGNTNLPLILLEEIVLSLQSCMESFPATYLDKYKLRLFCWQVISWLFTFVSGSMRGSAQWRTESSSSHMSVTESGNAPQTTFTKMTPIYNLSQDIRFNNGRGYEILGLLFAKVLSPQLEAQMSIQQAHDRESNSEDVYSGTNTKFTKGEFFVTAKDHRELCNNVNGLLSCCLTAYEIVAPQVVDANLSVIIRIAAKAAVRTPIKNISSSNNENNKKNTYDTLEQHTVFYNFLVAVITRLGQSNQLTLLLDALIAHKSDTTKVSQLKYKNEEEEEDNDKDDSEIDSITALMSTFGTHTIRNAMLEACGNVMDPEELLNRLIHCISSWSEEAVMHSQQDHDNKTHNQLSTHSLWRSHVDVLFALQLIALVVEGVMPTSVTSSAILEKTTELELLLCAFITNELYKNAISSNNDETNLEEEEQEEEDNLEKGEEVHIHLYDTLSPKQLRQMWLYALYALYQIRKLTMSCIRDLGMQNSEAYLQMLEETLWQVEHHASYLVNELSIEQLMTTMNATTQMQIVPYVHSQVLLPQLLLQRLSLTRSVCTLLHVTMENNEYDAKQMVKVFLSYCSIESVESNEEEAIKNSHDKANKETLRRNRRWWQIVMLLNAMTHEEWQSVMAWGKRRQVKKIFAELLTQHITREVQSTTHDFSDSNVHDNENENEKMETHCVIPMWIQCAIQCSSGVMLMVICEKFVSRTRALKIQEINQLVNLLLYACKTRSHLPQWVAVIHACAQLLITLASKTKYNVINQITTISTSKSTKWENVSQEVQMICYKLIECMCICLQCEGHSQEILRKALIALIKQVNKNKDKEIIETLSMTHKENKEEDVQDEEDMSKLCMILFSKDFVAAMFNIHMTQSMESEHTTNLHSIHITRSMNVMTLLYSVASSTLYALWREKAVQGESELMNTMAGEFMIHTATLFMCNEHEDEKTNDTETKNWYKSCNVLYCLTSFLQQVKAPLLITHIIGSKSKKHDLSKRHMNNSTTNNMEVEKESSCNEIDSNNNNLSMRKWVTVLYNSLVSLLQNCTQNENSVNKANEEINNYKECHALKATLQSIHYLFVKLRDECKAHESVFAEVLLSIDEQCLKEHNTSLLAMLAQMLNTKHEIYNNVQTISTILTLVQYGGKDGIIALFILREVYNIVLKKNLKGSHDNYKNSNNNYRCINLSNVLRLMCSTNNNISYDTHHSSAETRLRYDKTTANELWNTSKEIASMMGNTLLQNNKQRSLDFVNTLFDYCSVHQTLRDLLAALPEVLKLYSVMVESHSESDVYVLLHFVLNAAIPTYQSFTTSIEQWSSTHESSIRHKTMEEKEEYEEHVFNYQEGDDNIDAISHVHDLLQSAISMLIKLHGIPHVRFGQFKSQLRRLLLLATHSSIVPVIIFTKNTKQEETTLSPGHHEPESLWAKLIYVCSLNSSALQDDVNFLNEVWMFIQSILLVTPSQVNHMQLQAHNSINFAKYISSKTPPTLLWPVMPLSHDEMKLLLTLLSRTWIHNNVAWMRSSLLPLTLSSVFTSVLRGVECGEYDRSLLNQLASLFYQLVKFAESSAMKHNNYRSSTNKIDDSSTSISKEKTRKQSDANIEDNMEMINNSEVHKSSEIMKEEVHPISAIVLASTVAALFESARHYITVFTTFSNDLDFIASDFLNALRRHHLPKEKCAPIAHHAHVVIPSLGNSNVTFSDLIYTCVREETTKALLKQAALRLEDDEQNDDNNNNNNMSVDEDNMNGIEERRETERRHIFNVVETPSNIN